MLGKLYAEFPIRTVFFSSTIIFQGGSIMSAAAKNSIMFIMGRALAGLGAAGITSGVMIIVTYMAPAEKRATYTGILVRSFPSKIPCLTLSRVILPSFQSLGSLLGG